MPKEVVHLGKSTSIGALEANENQRRWSEDDYKRENKKPRHFYDITRSHLNFEIDRDGKVQPIGSSAPINERFEQRLKELGAPPLNPNAKWQPNRLVKFVFSGDVDFIRKMAFGDQQVNYDWDESVDNSKVKRNKAIEDWAKDTYKFIANRYGANNIVGFDVHLDENSPHIHCSIIPVVERTNKKGETKEVISYKSHFGKDKAEGQKCFLKLHDDYSSEVGEKWGFERGEDTTGKDIHHVNKIEYFAQLSKKSKALQTMITNLEQQKRELQKSYDVLTTQLECHEITAQQYEEKVNVLKERLALLDEKITDKQVKLMDANNKLGDVQKQQIKMEAHIKNMTAFDNYLTNYLKDNVHTLLNGSVAEQVINGARQAVRTIPEITDALDDTLLGDMMEYGKWDSVIETATLTFFNCVGGVPAGYQPSGGGGSSSDLPWRDKDEDLKDFARRCVRYAHARHATKRSKGRSV